MQKLLLWHGPELLEIGVRNVMTVVFGQDLIVLDPREDLNPSKKKSKVRKVSIDFCTLFLNWYKIPLWFVFRNFCKAPRDMRKYPQKCQKITGC